MIKFIGANSIESRFPYHLGSNNDWVTVIIRFSARGGYLLLVTEGRALIRDRENISFLKKKKQNVKQTSDVYLIENQKDWLMDLLSSENFKTGSFVWRNYAPTGT